MEKNREYKKGKVADKFTEKNVCIENSFCKHKRPLTFIPYAEKIYFFLFFDKW